MLDGTTAQLILIKLSFFRCSANEMKKGMRARDRGREEERDGEKGREMQLTML